MNLNSDQLSIETPELVAIEMPLAGIGSRFIALLIDYLIWTAGIIVLLLVGLIVRPAMRAVSSLGYQWTVAIVIFIVFLVNWGYITLFEAFWNGQTPGKRAAKIRVIQRSGRAIGLFESMARNLVRYIDQIPFFYAVGVITMFSTRNTSAWATWPLARWWFGIASRRLRCGRSPVPAPSPGRPLLPSPQCSSHITLSTCPVPSSRSSLQPTWKCWRGFCRGGWI